MRRRFVMSWTRRVALVLALLGALVFAGVASANISGTAKGIELPQGDGIYTLQGTWTDSVTGTHGTYTGTLTTAATTRVVRSLDLDAPHFQKLRSAMCLLAAL